MLAAKKTQRVELVTLRGGKSGAGLPARPAEMVTAIAAAQTVEQAAAYADTAKAVGKSKALVDAIARMSGEEAADVRRAYLEAALWAGRRVGELLPRNSVGGDRRSGSSPEPDPAWSKFPKVTRSRFRQLASLPRDEVEAQFAEWRAAGKDPTQIGLIRRAEQLGVVDKPKRKARKPRRSGPPPIERDLDAVEFAVQRLEELREQLGEVATHCERAPTYTGTTRGYVARGLEEIQRHLAAGLAVARELRALEGEA